MIEAQLHPQETARLKALLNYEVLDSRDEQAFDELTQLASAICGTPISLISLVDDHRQWFKSKVGIDASETGKDIAFCSHAILQEKVFEVSNALEDERFHDNPLVTGAPDIRFYAGAPLVSTDGMPIGTLCVIDSEPRKLDDTQRQALKVLAKQVIGQLELRIKNRRLERLNEQREKFFAMVAHDLRSPFNSILVFSRQLSAKATSLSPQDVEKMSGDILGSASDTFQLLDELLQWSQTCLDGHKCSFAPCQLETLIHEACSLHIQTAKVKEIDLEIKVEPDLCVHSDATLVKTVIRNLVANAIKYSGTGKLICVEAHTVKNEIEITVKDQGSGVPANKIRELFDNPLDSSKGTAGEHGTGLGLNLCKTFVDMLGGKIWYDDSYSEGACFVFSLGPVDAV